MKTVRLIVLIESATIVQLYFFGRFLLKAEVLANIITFLSIVFGFYITSLAILVTSKYVRSLYRLTDELDSSKTLLDTLVGNYKYGLISVLITIAYMISLHIVINQNVNNALQFSSWVAIPFMGVVLANIYYSYVMLTVLIKIILREAKST